MPFGTGDFSHDSACPICFEEYKVTDLVTQLECDSRHYYHTECIENWIKSGNNTCPVCRCVIHGFQFDEHQDSRIILDIA